MLFEETPVLSLGKLCEDHGYSYHWTSGQKPQLIKHGRRIKCNTDYVPLVVPGPSASSSSSATLTSPTPLPQEAVTPTQHPASTRSDSTGCIEAAWGDPSLGPAETENPNENRDDYGAQGDPLRDLPDWFEEFTENVVDGSVPEHKETPASSSRESASVLLLTSRRTEIATSA